MAGWFAAALCLLCGSPRAYAQADAGAPDATALPDQGGLSVSLAQHYSPPESASVGQRLELALEIEHPPGSSIHLPDGFGNPRWELVDTDKEPGGSETRAKTSLTLVFQIFRPGTTTLPSFPITVLSSTGASTELRTEPIEAKIVSVLPSDKTPPLEAHRDPVAVWAEDYTPAWTGGILLGALLAAGLTFLVIGRREDSLVGPPPRPAHVVALEKLSALTTDDQLDRGEHMLYYVRMSEAVREYLGRRYGFRGTELTTTEILENLREVDWPAGISFEDIREWLAHCDLVKFSGVVPARERAEQALRRGFSIVELTRPRSEESDAEPESEPDPESEPKLDPEPESKSVLEPEPEPEPEDEP